MAKIAVITRTKDRTHFLARAIESVASQTYSDYQHVIINDGGDKNVVDQVLAELNKSVREKITLFHREVSSDAPDTILTESVDRVKSEYVALHDDDDTWHPEFLERTIALLDSGAAGVAARVDNVVEEVAKRGFKLGKTWPYMPDLRAVSLYRQCLDNQLPTIGFVYRRDAYEAVGKYDITLPVVADWEFGIRFMQKYDVEYLDPGFTLAFYHHRKAKDNSFARHNHRKYITKVFNKYLRKELDEGRLGVGYIMNDLRYEQDMITRTVKSLVPGVVAKVIKRRVR